MEPFPTQTVLAPSLAKVQAPLAASLRGQGDAPGVGHLALLEVLHQLGQPTLGGGVVLQHLRKGAVLQLVGQALPQSFSGSERTKKG